MRVYVNYDENNLTPYQVCEFSIKKQHPDWDVLPLCRQDLRKKKIFTRSLHEDNEPDLTRFCVPYLTNYKGLALYCDSSLLINDSLQPILDCFDDRFAMACVKHYFETNKRWKQDKHVRSSLILWNCKHTANRQLTPQVINSADPDFLHELKWLTKYDVMGLPKTYNYLVGQYPNDAQPKVLNFMYGSPSTRGFENCDYANWWWSAFHEKEATQPTPVTQDMIKIQEIPKKEQGMWSFFKDWFLN